LKAKIELQKRAKRGEEELRFSNEEIRQMFTQIRESQEKLNSIESAQRTAQ